MTTLDERSRAILRVLEGSLLRDLYSLEIGEATSIAPPALYSLLHELEADGSLESYNGESIAERGNRPRRYYRITAKGRASLRQ